MIELGSPKTPGCAENDKPFNLTSSKNEPPPSLKVCPSQHVPTNV